MTSAKKISQYIQISPRFSRSINLVSDHQNPASSEGYIITENVASLLDTILDGLDENSGQRSYALLGPYGVGKSAFTVFLCQLLSQNKDLYASALGQMPNKFATIAERVKKLREDTDDKGFFIITMTARRQNIAQLIIQGIEDSLTGLIESDQKKQLQTKIAETLNKEQWHDTRSVLSILKDCQKLVKKSGFAGITLIIDEVGKTLEYAMQDAAGGDVYIFQEIAEYANRSNGCPFLFILTLHQMFDDYAAHSSRTVQNEWAKVQERFQSIQFRESAAATMQMMAQAIIHKKQLPSDIEAKIAEIATKMENAHIELPLGMDYPHFTEFAKQAWPLHPVTLLAMPYVFRRLAQNERSIFSYLASKEPFAFSSHVEKHSIGAESFVHLHHIYDYLLANFEGSLSRIPFAKRLLEANDILKSRTKLTKKKLQLIQTVALLNVLGDVSKIKATIPILNCAFLPVIRVRKDLEELKRQSLLVYRKLDETYRIWEGSDIDLEQRLAEAYRQLQISGKSILSTLDTLLPNRQLVARKHSLERGIHRYFNVSYADSPDNSCFKAADKDSQAAGAIVVLFPQQNDKNLLTHVRKLTSKRKDIVIAIPTQIDSLRQLVEDIACLRWVEAKTPELRDDRITRREITLRISQSEQQINRLLQILLDPRPAPVGNNCRWFWNGSEKKDLDSPVDVTRLLSKICDDIYRAGVKLKNELVVRNKISSAAASARRIVIEKMLTSADQEGLGIEGFPPERSIYESILKATGIHKCNDTWSLQEPCITNKSDISEAWSYLKQQLFRPNPGKVSVEELFNGLSRPPLGLPAGVHPIIFVAFYLVHQDELFLYRQNSFLAQVETAHLELLQKRPDLFSCSGVQISGNRKKVISRLAKGLQQPEKIASVVRALFILFSGLSSISKRSSRLLDDQTIAFRSTLQAAESPEQLLFVDLPKAFSQQPMSEEDSDDDQIEIFFAALNSCLTNLREHEKRLRKQCRNSLLEHFGFTQNSYGWQLFLQRASWLAPLVNIEVINPILQGARTAEGEKGERHILSLVAGRPYENWLDVDFDKFAGLAKGVGKIYQKTWDQYGSHQVALSDEEVVLKNSLTPVVKRLLAEKSLNKSPKVVAAILREYATELEQ